MNIKKDQQVWYLRFLIEKLGLNANEVLAKELHKSVIKKFKRRKVYSRCKDNIWTVHLAEMRSFSSNNEGVK